MTHLLLHLPHTRLGPVFLDPRDGQLARFCAEPWFPVELFKRMRWKPYCATWNCFTWNTMNPKHITSQEVTWTTSGSYRFHLISWHLRSKSKPLRASRADAKHVKHRLLNANAKPLQLQESGLRTHKTTAFELVPCRIMCICLFGGLEWSANCCLSRFGFVTVLLALLSQGVWKKYEETIFFSPWNFYHWARNHVGFTR